MCRADGGGGGRDTGVCPASHTLSTRLSHTPSTRLTTRPAQDGAYFAAKCTAHPREEGGTVFLIRIGHEDSEEQKEPELVEMRPVLPLADRALA